VLQKAGATSLRAIADGLNAQGIPTARGSGEWSAVQVMRMLERIEPFCKVGGKPATAAQARAAIFKGFGAEDVGEELILTTECGCRFDQ